MEAGREGARCCLDFDFCLSHSIPVFGLNPVELSGRWREGGVLALIRFEFPGLGREAAGLLSHHPETLPSRHGSFASFTQPHCRMNNHTAVVWIR